MGDGTILVRKRIEVGSLGITPYSKNVLACLLNRRGGCVHITFALRGGGSSLFTLPYKRTRGECRVSARGEIIGHFSQTFPNRSQYEEFEILT